MFTFDWLASRKSTARHRRRRWRCSLFAHSSLSIACCLLYSYRKDCTRMHADTNSNAQNKPACVCVCLPTNDLSRISTNIYEQTEQKKKRKKYVQHKQNSHQTAKSKLQVKKEKKMKKKPQHLMHR